MTYEAFKLIITEQLKITTYIENDKTEYDYKYRGQKNASGGSNFISVSWATGGFSGGSCWDDSNPRPYTSHEQPKELSDLDLIIGEFCPEINFLTYKKLAHALVETFTYCENEYYGNSTDYAGKKCDLRKLYAYLKEEIKAPKLNE